jgi:hypothetical protein
MKKGLLTLTVLALLLVGAVGFGAQPELWGIPDIIIGDAEDFGVSDDLFIFTDAFAFADFFHWVTDGAKAEKWHFMHSDPLDVLTINRQLPDITAIADISAGFTTASFRDVLLSPPGGPWDSNPPVIGIVTDTIIVSIQIDNALLVDDQDFACYIVDDGFDELTNEYYKIDVANIVMTSDPGWYYFEQTISAAANPPYGISTMNESYNSTSDALVIESDGDDNDFGAWVMPDLDYTHGAAYIFIAELFATPIYPDGASSGDFVCGVRLRANVKNETCNALSQIQSLGIAAAGISTDWENPSTHVLIFDPRDQSDVPLSLQKIYFNFDAFDFEGHNRDYAGQLDDEGAVGIKSVKVETFPVKMMWKETTSCKSYPEGASFYADISDYIGVRGSFFGGNAPVATTGAGGTLKLDSVGVTSGFAYWQLVDTSGLMMADDGSDYYALKFVAKTSHFNVDLVRFRAMDTFYQNVSEYSLVNVPGAGGLQEPGPAGDIYNVFFDARRPHFNNVRLRFGMDMGDSTEGLDMSAELCGVEMRSCPLPAPTP